MSTSIIYYLLFTTIDFQWMGNKQINNNSTLGGSKESRSESEALGNLSLMVRFSFFLSAPDNLCWDFASTAFLNIFNFSRYSPFSSQWVCVALRRVDVFQVKWNETLCRLVVYYYYMVRTIETQTESERDDTAYDGGKVVSLSSVSFYSNRGNCV